MLAWESRNNRDILPDHQVCELLKEHTGKKSTKNANTDIAKNIAEIGESLQLLKTNISNIVFFKTDNYDITEHSISHWLSQEIGMSLFYNRCEIYVKQVSDPYPLLQSHQQFL